MDPSSLRCFTTTNKLLFLALLKAQEPVLDVFSFKKDCFSGNQLFAITFFSLQT